MSYLRYLCLFAYSGVQHILCCVLIFFVKIFHRMLPVSLSIFDFPFGILLTFIVECTIFKTVNKCKNICLKIKKYC